MFPVLVLLNFTAEYIFIHCVFSYKKNIKILESRNIRDICITEQNDLHWIQINQINDGTFLGLLST